MLPICILFDVQYSGCYIKSLSGHLFKQINPFFFTPMFYMLLPLIIFLLHLNFPDTIRDIPYTVVFFLIFQFAFPMKMCVFFFLFVLVPWLIMRQRSLICMFSASLTFKFNLKYRDFMPIVDLVYINSSAL